MNQLRNWSYRVLAALVIAFNVLAVLSVSMAGYGHSGCVPNPCRTTLACLLAHKPLCFAPTTVKNCKCQCLPGLRICGCLSTLPH